MTTIRHVLAATDLSPPSIAAVNRAFEVAATTRAVLTLISALGLNALGPLRELLGEQADTVSRRIAAQQREALGRLAADPERNRGVVAHLIVEEGLATNVVPACASVIEADLVVVGARGDSLVRRLLVGSTASHLLRKSACPVLVVRRDERTPYRRALLAVDFSPAAATSIRLVRDFAPKADLVLHHVFDVPFEGMLQHAGVGDEVIHDYRIQARERALRRIHALAEEAGLETWQYTPVVEYGDATSRILARAERDRCDLIAMGKHGTHVTEELLLGSVTKRVLEAADRDVLVVVDRRVATTDGWPEEPRPA